MFHAMPRPVVVRPVPPVNAGFTGHESRPPAAPPTVPACKKRTATLPDGTPLAGTGSHDVSGCPASAMRPKLVTSYVVPSRSTVICAGFFHAFATKTAKHGDL